MAAQRGDDSYGATTSSSSSERVEHQFTARAGVEDDDHVSARGRRLRRIGATVASGLVVLCGGVVVSRRALLSGAHVASLAAADSPLSAAEAGSAAPYRIISAASATEEAAADAAVAEEAVAVEAAAAAAAAGLADAGLSLTAENEYGALASLEYYPWDHIVEPYHVTQLTAIASAACRGQPQHIEGNGASCTYEWAVTYEWRGEAHTLVDGALGIQINAEFQHAGTKHALTLTERRSTSVGTPTTAGAAALAADADDDDGAVVTTTHTTVLMCKYVRRRLETLAQRDLDDYLDALEIIHRTELADGRAKYGDKFANYKWFTAMHLSRTTKDNCSPYHGSMSFLPSHEAFFSRLDEALHSINPRISQPYWDTTLEDVTTGAAWAEAARIFDDDMFGRGGANPEHAIDTGRFAYLPVATDYSLPERNAFGRQTMVWNEDDARHVARATTMCGLKSKARLPGCTALRGAFNFSSIVDFRAKLETDFHGTLHPFAGGMWDCPLPFSDVLDEHPDWAALMEFIGSLLPTAYDVSFDMKQVAGMFKVYEGMQCPESCDAPVAGSNASGWRDCQCFNSYVDALHASGGLNYTTAYDHLQARRVARGRRFWGGLFSLPRSPAQWVRP